MMFYGATWLGVLAILCLSKVSKVDSGETERSKRAIAKYPFKKWGAKNTIRVKPKTEDDTTKAKAFNTAVKKAIETYGMEKCLINKFELYTWVIRTARHFLVKTNRSHPKGIAVVNKDSAVIDVLIGDDTTATAVNAMHVLNLTVTAFGLLYEDRSPDRNHYIKAASGRFEDAEYPSADIQHVDQVPYDVSSFLHKNKFGLYQNKTGTKVKLQPLFPMLQHEKYDNLGMGARLAREGNYLSFRDVKTLSSHFECENVDSLCALTDCDNGGYVDASCECICPRGLNGTTCQMVAKKNLLPSTCGNVTKATQTLKTVLAPHFPDDYTTGENCFWLIKSTNTKRRVMFNLELFNSSCDTSKLTIYMYGPEVDLHPLSCNELLKKTFVDKWFSSQLSYMAVAWKTEDKVQTGRNGFKFSFVEGCVDDEGKVGFCLPDTKNWDATKPIHCYNCNSSVNPLCALGSTLNPLDTIKCEAGSSCYTQVTKQGDALTISKSCALPTEPCVNNEEACRNNKQCTICCKTPLCNKEGAAKKGDDPFTAIKNRIQLTPITTPLQCGVPKLGARIAVVFVAVVLVGIVGLCW
ncbi:uncharacterized protein LOC135494889 [Lineus longissimus]|uniref:uncharacterized protein LOC135494889 n=1 Tax=Lineus longissimus TaxID=88925 RepID=UPI002B4D8DA3